MKKIMVLSYDDGTIHDKRLIQLLNKYNIPATFNLNSGLDDFVWKTRGKDIHRLTLRDNVDLYKGHEVAVHTRTHPYLTELTETQLHQEVVKDQETLSHIFGYTVITMGVPFNQCNEAIIDKIKHYGVIKNLRIPNKDTTFNPPNDTMHIPITTTHTSEDIVPLTEAFLNNDKPLSLFVLAGHAYDFYLDNNWKWFENYLKKLTSHPDVTFMTVKDAMSYLFKS